MSEVTVYRYRIEPGKTERLREWMADLRSRRDEAVETLRHEGVLTESAFLERRPDGDYVTFYVEAEDLDAATEAFENSPYDIDEEFERLLAQITADDQPDVQIEPLYHLVNPDRTGASAEGE